MPEGFAGFQTPLSESFNKARQEDDPFLEAFLDPNGRLAFRKIDTGGNILPQPKVTTPGFVPPSLNTPGVAPSTTTPLASGSSTASENLVNRPTTQGASSEGPGQTQESQSFSGNVIGQGPLSDIDKGLLSGLTALGLPSVVGLTSLADRLNLTAVIEDIDRAPLPGTVAFAQMIEKRRAAETESRAKRGLQGVESEETGFSADDPGRGFGLQGRETETTGFSADDVGQLSNDRSRETLDSMSPTGTDSGPGGDTGRGGGTNAGDEEGGKSAIGAEGPSGGETSGPDQGGPDVGVF